MLLRNVPNDFAALIEATANELAYPAAFVERDYWITEILRSIARPVQGHDAAVIFKGGTSLSKGRKLIRRMSEDVDVLVTFGPGVSKNARDAVLKGLVARAEADVGITASGGRARKSVHRTREFIHPQRYAHGALTGQRVLLELGTRGGPEPHERLAIRSLVADVAVSKLGIAAAEFTELAPVDIDTLARERTFLEKLAALHHLASTFDRDASAERLGTKLRHAYDVAMLLDDPGTVAALGAGNVAEMVLDIERHSIQHGFGWTARPANGYADSPAFDEPFISSAAVQEAYGRALELVVAGPRPSLADVAAAVRGRAELL